MEKNEILKDLLQLVESDIGDEQLLEKLSDYHKGDIAEIYPEMSESARKRLSGILPVDEFSEIIAYLDNPEDYIENMDKEHAADILESMDADDAVDVLEELDEEAQSRIIQLMDADAVEDINLIRSYDDEEVGSRMTTNYILVREDMSVKQAMRATVEQAADNDNVSTIYVENKDGEYCGAIELRDLIVARAGTLLNDIIMTSYPSVYATETIAECIERLKDYGEDSIPVLGEDGKILGVITSVDLVEAVDDELGEDYAKFAGLTDEEDLKEPLVHSIRKRIPWLFVLFFLGLGVSTVVSQFENVIASLAYIVSFQSLVLDMAGNVGTQSLAVTIRVLTGEDLSGRKIAKLIWKELRVGVTNGLILGTLAFTLIGAFLCIPGMGADTVQTAFLASGCIGIALLVAMIASAFFGTVIPIIFKKIKIDPAVASGPLITTINDLIAVCIYYGLAWLLILNVFA